MAGCRRQPVPDLWKIWKELVRRSDSFHATPEGAEAKLKSVTWIKDTAYLEFELDTVRGGAQSNLTMPITELDDKSVVELLS